MFLRIHATLLKVPKMIPRRAQEGLKTPLQEPKRGPKEPKRSSRWPHNGPKTTLRRLQDGPSCVPGLP